MLDILEDLVKSKGYDYVRLDGTTSATERGKRVDQFNKKPSVFLFLLSTRAGGVGINLVSASFSSLLGTLRTTCRRWIGRFGSASGRTCTCTAS